VDLAKAAREGARDFAELGMDQAYCGHPAEASAAEGERYVWEQQLAGSPFERHLRSSKVEIGLRPAGGGTEVSIASEQKLRGMSRLGSPLMRGGQGKILDQALDGLETALGGSR